LGSRPRSHIPTFAHWRTKIMTTETTKQVEPLFEIGRTVATPGALSTMQNLNIDPITLLKRHIYGDWQDMDADDQEANREAVNQEARIFSAFVFGEVKFWVITEADRSSTTILFPEEY